MGSNQGSIGFNQKRENPVIPAVNGADNGLTIIAGNVELGGVNALIHNTFVNLDIFDLTFKDAAFTFLALEPGAADVIVGDVNATMRADMANGITFLGDWSTAVNGTVIQVNDPVSAIEMQSAGSQRFIMDAANNIYQFGDIGQGNMGSFIEILDGQPEFNYYINISSGRLINLNGNGGSNVIATMGDVDSVTNATKLIVDDGSQAVTMSSASSTGLLLSLQTFVYQMGDILANNNGGQIIIDDGANVTQLLKGGFIGLELDYGNTLFRMGDVSGVNRNTLITVNDAVGGANENITLAANNGIYINEASTAMLHYINALPDGAGGSIGTLANAPSAGDPSKWIPIDDAGTIRYIPAW